MNKKNTKKKLSKVQERALGKLSLTEWKDPYELRESLSTLKVLVKRGYVEDRGSGPHFSGFTNRIDTEYRKKK